MSNQLARSSQDSAQRRLRRLSFRPRVEKTTEGDDQATVKVPVSTLHYVQRRREFLVAPRPPRQEKEPQEEQKKLPQSRQFVQRQQNKVRLLLPAIQEQTGNNSRLLVTKLGQEEQVETMRLPVSGSEDDMSLLETLALLTPDLETTQVLRTPDDDPEFEKL